MKKKAVIIELVCIVVAICVDNMDDDCIDVLFR